MAIAEHYRLSGSRAWTALFHSVAATLSYAISSSDFVYRAKHSTLKPRPFVTITKPFLIQAVSPAPRTPPKNSDTADNADNPSISTTTNSRMPSVSSFEIVSVSFAKAANAGPLQNAIWNKMPLPIARTTFASAFGIVPNPFDRQLGVFGKAAEAIRVAAKLSSVGCMIVHFGFASGDFTPLLALRAPFCVARLLLQHPIQELKHRLRRLVVGKAEGIV
jgi:hypothetical protein